MEDYLLTSTVNGILAQRLVRKLDLETAERYEALPEVVEQFHLDRLTEERPIKLYRPTPTAAGGSGYFGRSTIMEFLVMSDPMRRLIMQHAGMGELEQQARAEGMQTMYEDGIIKSLQGRTTLEEVLRVTSES